MTDTARPAVIHQWVREEMLWRTRCGACGLVVAWYTAEACRTRGAAACEKEAEAAWQKHVETTCPAVQDVVPLNTVERPASDGDVELTTPAKTRPWKSA